jgi:hypothetical protein
MTRRFTLADLLFWVTLAALVLAFIVPMGRAIQRAAEATWALECIAGQVLGSSPGVWEKWWQGLNGPFGRSTPTGSCSVAPGGALRQRLP